MISSEHCQQQGTSKLKWKGCVTTIKNLTNFHHTITGTVVATLQMGEKEKEMVRDNQKMLLYCHVTCLHCSD